MMDSVQYSKDEFSEIKQGNFEAYGMSSVSDITKGVIHNKETKLGIMQ